MLYNERRIVYLAGYNGSVSNTFKTAFNAVQSVPEDGLETYSNLSGLGPVKIYFSGTREFYGINSDNSVTRQTLVNPSLAVKEVKGSWKDFYITGGAVDIEVFRSQGSNPPHWDSLNRNIPSFMPDPIPGSGEI